MVRQFILAFLGVLLVPGTVLAQDVRVQASVNSNVVGTDERVVYTITVEGASMGDVERPDAPSTSNLSLLQSTPSTQHSTTIINGRMQQSIGFRWTYRPLAEGRARIGAATVRVDGETFRTEPIDVEVVPQSQRPQRTRPANPFGNQRATPGRGDDGPAVDDDDIFIRALPSQRTAYQNEQVTITYRLYFREGVRLRQSRLADSWDAEGFWREDLEVEGRPRPTTEVVDGQRYRTIVLKRVAVFPTRTGALTVEPLRIETDAYVPRRSRDPFESLFGFGGDFQAVELESPAVHIESLPLPDGAPPTFRGGVGEYDLSVWAEKSQVEVGQAVEVVVRVSGAGNLATLEAPDLDVPGVFEAYDPEVETSIERRGQRIRGAKSFAYTLVPRSNGSFELPPVRYSYFDPSAETYRTEVSEPLAVDVTGTATAPPAASTTGGGLPVDDIAAPLAEAERWHRTDATPLHRNPWTYTALLAPWLAILGVWGWRRRVDHLAANPALARSRRAHPEARRRLAEAQSLHDADARAFYAAVERAVLGFVGDRLGVAPQGLTRDELDEVLHEADVPERHRQTLYALLDQCDRARFAPAAVGRADRDAALAEARDVIADLDDAIQPPTHA